MEFLRIDEVVNGLLYVRYTVMNQPGYDLTISASRQGVEFSGTCRPYTDYTPLQQVLSWAQYQSQRIRETGASIPQAFLDRGEL